MERFVGLVLAAVLAAACGRTNKDTSNPDALAQAGAGAGVGTAGHSGTTADAGTGSVGGFAPCTVSATLAPAGLRPLGQAELRNELAALGEPLTGMELPARFSRIYQLVDLGSNSQQPDLDSGFLQKHATFVAGLAERVTADAERLGQLLSCDVAGDAVLCTAHLFDFVMERLLRGLADEGRRAQLEAVFAEEEQLSGFQGGARALLGAALQAPEFLHHVELGRPVKEDGVAKMRLTDLELASRLSFLFWGSGPDAELLQVARAGRLSEPSELAAAAQRLLNDPRAELGIARFYRELLGIDEGRRFDADSGVAPDVLVSMDREFSRFVWHATLDEGKGDAASLVEPVSWVNGELADYYGWAGVEGDAFRAVELDPTRYAGLLTLPAWLTRASGPSFTHPSVRGWWVARGLLCASVPPEPEGVAQSAGPPNLTERQRLAVHSSQPACVACHRVVDPPGLALEHFDAVGRYREDDDGLVIDTSDLPALNDAGSFDGARGLADQVLAASTERFCLTQQWIRFALGAALLDEGGGYECPSELELLSSRAQSVPELLVALSQTEAFRYRAPSP
ncbi:MAG TPA: DUF1592 domain-containing protein [Polyangiaceae bacterium]|nr:DUF1592 domain-containing protein [Polyangiaceae bacterium]